jgi:hypothetical protein
VKHCKIKEITTKRWNVVIYTVQYPYLFPLFPVKLLKPKLVEIILKDSVRTSKTTPHFTITKINWLMLFKEIIAVCSENHTKPTYTNTALQSVKTAGIYGTYYYH